MSFTAGNAARAASHYVIAATPMLENVPGLIPILGEEATLIEAGQVSLQFRMAPARARPRWR